MFRFKLQRILDYKSAMEDQKKAQLGDAEQQQRCEQLKLAQYQQQKQGCQATVSGQVDICSLLQRQRFTVYLDEKINHQHQTLVAAKNMVRQRQVELMESMKERKILDKVKEKRLQVYQYETGVREQKLIDDLTTASFIRKKIDKQY